jgi:NADH-quinone oxidoreductase subunit G
MVKVTIDGKICEVDPKRTIIEAARENGIEIPHFCWHPRLSIAGNCRMCLVEVEKAPKLVIACATRVADGMVVQTKSPKVINAREAVMEFLLINHPLDCPICDEAGECKLQDYAYKYSVGYSRFDEDKVHKPKRVELGPHVLLDTERCIMCSRCVRFCAEVAGKPQLTFTQRGDHVELTTFPGEKLDNPYSMNVIDLCPVGALTSREFRFRARVWEMSATETICPGCSRGCNIYSWVRNNEILRHTPRYNPDVNDHWMCDFGRLTTLRQASMDHALKGPMVKSEGSFREAGWDEAIARVASELKSFKKSEIAFVASAYSTNEDLFVLRKLAREVVGVKGVVFCTHVAEGDQDSLLIRADKTPNSHGAEALGMQSGPALASLLKAIKDGQARAMLIVEDNIAADPAVADLLSRLQFLAVASTAENETTRCADVVLAASSYAEKNGTFVNSQGHVQRIRPSIATIEQDRALDGFAMSRLDKYGSPYDRWNKGPRRDARPSWRILSGIAQLLGAKFRYNTAEDVFGELAASVEAFRGITYRKIGSRGVRLKTGKQAPVSAS